MARRRPIAAQCESGSSYPGAAERIETAGRSESSQTGAPAVSGEEVSRVHDLMDALIESGWRARPQAEQAGRPARLRLA